MVFNDGDTQFLVFDITWEGDKPVMALRYTIKHGISAIRQMNWDYAGNIICSGDAGIHIVSLPKDVNVTTVPAKKALTVVVGNKTTGVENIATEATLDLNAPMYDVLGRIEDRTYRGIVIQNGQAFLLQ